MCSADRALLTIDCTPEVVNEATRLGCEAIVAYHPPIFDGLKRLTKGHVAFDLVRLGIGVVSPHTAPAVASGGTPALPADPPGPPGRPPLPPSPLASAARRATSGVGAGGRASRKVERM